jgi:hypothetical protein
MEQMTSLKRTARTAGLLYLLLIIATAYSHVYVPSQLLVRGDNAATANNILNNEFLFRTCVVVNLAGAIVFLFLSLTIYTLFKQVNNRLASSLVAVVAVQIPVVFVLGVFKLTALMILKNNSSQLPDFYMLFLEMNGYGMMTLSLLGGLWLLPFGLLVYKSGFIPRAFGVLLIIAAAGYIGDALVLLIAPNENVPQLLPYILFVLGEIPIMLWLLIKGMKDHLSIDVIAEVQTRVRTPKFEEHL